MPHPEYLAFCDLPPIYCEAASGVTAVDELAGIAHDLGATDEQIELVCSGKEWRTP